MRIVGLVVVAVLLLAAAYLILTRPSAEQREQAAAAARGLRNAGQLLALGYWGHGLVIGTEELRSWFTDGSSQTMEK